MKKNEQKAYDLIARRNGITNSQIMNDSLHESIKSMGGLVGQLPVDAKSALEDVTLLEVAVRARKRKGLAPILFKAEHARNVFAAKAGDKKFSPLTYKRGYYIDKASPIKVAKGKDGTYVLTNQKGEVLAMANDAKTAQRQRVALSKASVIAPGKTIKSKNGIPVAKSVDKRINDKDWKVRAKVAKQGHDQDLDVLVHDKEWPVRRAVAKHGREKDLDILVRDEDKNVRSIVAEAGRDKDLDVLTNDKDFEVLYSVIQQGRDKDLYKFAYDKSNDNWMLGDYASEGIYHKDLNHLKKMQEEGKLTQTDIEQAGCYIVEDLANKLNDWRKDFTEKDSKNKLEDKKNLVKYGRDYDRDEFIKEYDRDDKPRKTAEKEDDGPEL